MSVISQNDEYAKSLPITRHVVTHQNNIIANQAKLKKRKLFMGKCRAQKV